MTYSSFFDISVSVIMPTYNRAYCINNSITSVINSFDNKCDYEIIIIDDDSTDNTAFLIEQDYAQFIMSGVIKILRNDYNVGVSNSRNRGISVSKGKWLLFLDSDDALIHANIFKFFEVLIANAEKPIIFFRCIDQNGSTVGIPIQENVILDSHLYIKCGSFGEALTVVNKQLVMDFRFDPLFNGYEGLSLVRVINKFGDALLANLPLRVYDCSRNDRLSVSKGKLDRMLLIATGHLKMVKEFRQYMSFQQMCSYICKATIYYIVGGIYKVFSRNKKC